MTSFVPRFLKAAFTALALFSVANVAQAQPRAQLTYTPPPQPAWQGSTDVAWEQRREPYAGGPLRPGMQLEEQINSFSWIGLAAFAAGWALGFTVFDQDSKALIPFAGGLLTEVSYITVIGAVLQAGGVIASAYGFLSPRVYVVYDAPVGSPSIQGLAATGVGVDWNARF